MKRLSSKIVSIVLAAAVMFQLLLVCPAGSAMAVQDGTDGAQQTQTQLTEDSNSLPDSPPRVQPRVSETPLTQINNIIIFIRFQGDDEYVTQSGIQNAQVNCNTGSDSLKQYISTMSYGALTVDSYFFPKDAQGNIFSYQFPQPQSYYETSDPETGDTGHMKYHNAINDMLADPAMKAQLEAAFTGNELDNDRDGVIDSIVIVSPTDGGIWSGPIWPSYNGKVEMNTGAAIQNKTSYQSIHIAKDNVMESETRTLIHEFLHRLGLPDLYRRPGPNQGMPVGNFDIMADGNVPQNLLQYQQRNVLGWGTPIDEVTSDGQYTLKLPEYQDKEVDGGADGTPETALILKSPDNAQEFFVVEYRGHQAYDAQFGWQSGLLVYRVNTDRPSNMYPPDHIYIFRPGETSLNQGGGQLFNAMLSFAGGRTSLGKDFAEELEEFDNGTLSFTNGSNSGIEINLVANENPEDTSTITFQVTYHSRGSGTLEDPYLVTSIGDLQSMGNKNHYKLVKDLDASGYTNYVPAFLGGDMVFDGNGHTISNLTFNRYSSSAASGVFASVGSGSVVKNLTLKNCSIQGRYAQCGILAGANYGTVENVRVIGGSVDAEDSWAGGIVGYSGPGGVVKDCFSSAQVRGNRAGGLVGRNYYGMVLDSLAAGTVIVSGNSPRSGGIVGDNVIYQASDCDNCYWIPAFAGQSVGIPGQAQGVYEIVIPTQFSITSNSPVALPAVCNAQGEVYGGVWTLPESYFNPVKISGSQLVGLYNHNGTLIYQFPIGSNQYPIIIPVQVSGLTNPQFILTAQLDNYVAVYNGSAGPIYQDGYHRVFLHEGTTMAPLRMLSECAGLTVEYNGVTNNTVVTNPNNGEYIQVNVGETTLNKYSAEGVLLGSMTMPAAPMLIDGRTYIPLRAVTESFGFQVYYREHTDGRSYVTITNRSPAFTTEDITALCDDAVEKIIFYMKNNI